MSDVRANKVSHRLQIRRLLSAAAASDISTDCDLPLAIPTSLFHDAETVLRLVYQSEWHSFFIFGRIRLQVPEWFSVFGQKFRASVSS